MTRRNLSGKISDAVAAAVAAPARLAFYHGVLRDPAVSALINWLAEWADGNDRPELRTRFLAETAARATSQDGPGLHGARLDAWQALFIDRVLYDANPFTEAAERMGERVPGGLLRLAADDLRLLGSLYIIPDLLREELDPAGTLSDLACEPPSEPDPLLPLREPIVRRLAGERNWENLAPVLARWHRRAGAGVFARHVAFRWESQVSGGALVPIRRPHLVEPDALFEYETERAAVFRNTEKFMQGLPAQNVLLYGNRGTGKSATVKAVLHSFASHGLRMVEVPRRALTDIPAVLQALEGRGLRTILFVDDLSFDAGDDEYKELKAVLEGTLEGRPENVLIYATSNRRHLVEQRRSDRSLPSDEDVHPWDGMEERLSLADRFGLTVIFPPPDQGTYLSIVESIARRRGLDVPREKLHKKALEWTVWHDGRSPRAAERFVDYLESELRYRPLSGEETVSNRRT